MKIRYIQGIILIALIFVSLAAPAVSQMGGHGKDVTERGPWNASEMMEQGRGFRHEAGMQGMGFMHRGAGMFGHYITFEIDDATGAINNYSIAKNEIFSSIVVDDEFDYGDTQVMGSLTKIVDSSGKTVIHLHDNPAAVINIFSSSAYTVNFTLADGMTAADQEDNMIKIESSTSDVVVYIIYSDGDFVVNTKDSIVSIKAPEDGSVVVRALPVNMPGLGQLNRLLVQEIARNRVGAEVCLGLNGSMNMVNYSRQLRIRMELMDHERIRLKVDSEDPAGKILAFNLDNTSLMLRERDRLRIYYDGTSLQCTDDPEELFAAKGIACLVAQQTRNRAQIMIHVPEFSEHTIEIVVEPEEVTAEEIETELPTATATGVPGFELAIATSGLLLAVYVMRKRLM